MLATHHAVHTDPLREDTQNCGLGFGVRVPPTHPSLRRDWQTDILLENHRQAATAIRTTFPGGPKSQKTMDGRQKPFCARNKVDYPPRVFLTDAENTLFFWF